MDAEQELDSLLDHIEEELKAGNIDPDDVSQFIESAIQALKKTLAELPDSQEKRKALAALAHFWKTQEQRIAEIENRHFNEYLQKRPNRGQF